MLRSLLPVALLLCACSTTPAPVTWVGSVTTLAPVLCVGRHDATGDCFTGESAAELPVLHVGECVSVTFTPHAPDVEGPESLSELHPTSASGHESDCPPAP